MSLTQASDTENIQLKITIDKQSKNGDEQIEGMSVTDPPEFTDPAILVVRREIIKIRYTRDELIKLRDVPMSKKKPDFFDEISPCILDPDRWSFDRKKSETSTENGPRSGGGEGSGNATTAAAANDQHRRRPGDPRERVRKENDGIVLSPQRRSFNSGCFVPVNRSDTARGNRSHSPLGGKNDGSHIGGMREIQTTGTRRIGSGRILRDSWDFGEKPDSGQSEHEYGFRGAQRSTISSNTTTINSSTSNNNNNSIERNEDKFERRSFGRDFDSGRDNNNKEMTRRNGRYDRRRITDHREIEEPEWFSGGPVSQSDTIELRGFDDADKPKKKLSPSRLKRAKEWSKKKTELQQNIVDDKEEAKDPALTPQAGVEDKTALDRKKGEMDKKKKEEPPAKDIEEKTQEDKQSDQSFNFEDILKCDTIPGLLPNGTGADGDSNTKSRFSRWFKQDSPEKLASRPSSSLHDDHHIIKDLLMDIGETSVTIPGDSEAYFAPISPAANTGGIIGGKRANQQQQQSINIMEMLQRGGQGEGGGNKQQQQQQQTMTGKIFSLDELEAKIRQSVGPAMVAAAAAASAQKQQQQSQPHQKPDEEMSAAFKKLLAQAMNHPTPNGPINKSQPMSLLEMLSHSQQQDEAARLGTNAHGLGPASPGVGHHHHHHHHQQQHHHHHTLNDLTMKLQQAQLQQQQKQQMEMLNKLINATSTTSSSSTTAAAASVHPAAQLRTSPLHDIGVQQSRELLNRPEAQAILHGLKRGEITTQHLYQQLGNPALQPRHREMLMTILKMQGTAGYGPSPRVLSPAPSHHMFQQQQQQQQQQLRVSPLPPNAYCVSPILATSPNTLTVPAMHQRIPSPRELQVHTQNILQRALIKKKLEEQQENYRKKQEMQRGQSPSAGGGAKSMSSPTPLAFTPTSVLRKMTAEKDDGKENKSIVDGKIPPGRALTGVRPQPQQQQAQQQQQQVSQGQQWGQQFASMKHPGRPIVKANNNYQSQTPEQFFSQHQQQQQRMFNQQGVVAAAAAANQQQRKPLSSQFGSGQGVAQSQYNPQQYSTNQQFTQQQLRAQHQHRPANQQQPSAMQQQRGQQQMGGYQQQQQASQQPMATGWQQLFNNAQANRTTANPIGRSALNDGDLSPTTSNQLARWFSPDLLERARGGELPSTAGLAQHALSLEEIERQAAAPPVHN